MSGRQRGMGGTSACAACVLSIQCRNYAPADVTAMNAEIWISNTGSAAIPLRQIKVRYYYVNEGGPMALEIFDKAFKQPDGTDLLSSAASFSMTTGKLAAPRMDFSDIAIGGSEALAGTVPFYFKMSIHDQAHTPARPIQRLFQRSSHGRSVPAHRGICRCGPGRRRSCPAEADLARKLAPAGQSATMGGWRSISRVRRARSRFAWCRGEATTRRSYGRSWRPVAASGSRPRT